MNRLRELRKELKKSQLDIAELLGISRQAYSNYELNLREPDFANLMKLAEIFRVPADFLLTDEVEWHDSIYSDFKKVRSTEEKYEFFKYHGIPTKMKNVWFNVKSEIEAKENSGKHITNFMIPVLGTVPAGIPLEAIEEVLDYEEITEDMARNGKYIALQIKGDSMLPTICNGDVVIVRLQPDVESGETAIVMVNGDDATCKKVVKHTSGITIVPNNPAYEPRFFTNEEISSTPVRILGKVVELRRKF